MPSYSVELTADDKRHELYAVDWAADALAAQITGQALFVLDKDTVPRVTEVYNEADVIGYEGVERIYA